MAFFRLFAAGAVVGLVALMNPQAASAGASLAPEAGQAALPALDGADDIVKVAEQWRGERWRRGRWRGGDWHKRAPRHKWRMRRYSRDRHRHYHRHYRRRGSDLGFALGATGLFLGLSALAARPYYNGYYGGYSGGSYGGYSGAVSNNCSRFEPWSTPWYRCCSAKYRTFDPRTGTYNAYSGRTRFCQ